MKKSIVLITSATLISFPAFAFDCTKTHSRVDALICSKPKLKTADQDMSAAYFKLLHETSDTDFHKALIESQRQWLKLRSAKPERYGAAEGDKTDDAEVMLKLTLARLDFFRQSKPIRNMERQRELAKNASGGAFAGFYSGCQIVPPPYGYWSYQCIGTEQQQNNDRVCSITTEVASGHLTDYRQVSTLKNGTPKTIASCATGYDTTSEPCPDSGQDNAHWNINPKPSADSPVLRTRQLSKYDPDIEFADDDDWIKDCLSARTYP